MRRQSNLSYTVPILRSNQRGPIYHHCVQTAASRTKRMQYSAVKKINTKDAPKGEQQRIRALAFCCTNPNGKELENTNGYDIRPINLQHETHGRNRQFHLTLLRQTTESADDQWWLPLRRQGAPFATANSRQSAEKSYPLLSPTRMVAASCMGVVTPTP
jgi:hypothetical protein